ncbi:hypothetical protein NEOKW01_0741 [Nematocida sp. AWRm80]|nr:hypothetical protein NEOKW01_0741 [Nematocida sp. AWRm80]
MNKPKIVAYLIVFIIEYTIYSSCSKGIDDIQALAINEDTSIEQTRRKRCLMAQKLKREMEITIKTYFVALLMFCLTEDNLIEYTNNVFKISKNEPTIHIIIIRDHFKFVTAIKKNNDIEEIFNTFNTLSNVYGLVSLYAMMNIDSYNYQYKAAYNMRLEYIERIDPLDNSLKDVFLLDKLNRRFRTNNLSKWKIPVFKDLFSLEYDSQKNTITVITGHSAISIVVEKVILAKRHLNDLKGFGLFTIKIVTLVEIRLPIYKSIEQRECYKETSV